MSGECIQNLSLWQSHKDRKAWTDPVHSFAEGYGRIADLICRERDKTRDLNQREILLFYIFLEEKKLFRSYKKRFKNKK
jgi:hypothetical protein